MSNNRIRTAAWQRTGKVCVLIAVMLPTVLVPLLAIGVDGGTLMEDRRRLQTAVDAAALSAAAQLFYDNPNHSQNQVQPPQTAGARTAALDALDTQGFPTGMCQNRTVNIPANSSNVRLNGRPGTAEVLVTYLQPRAFSRIWGTNSVTVTARAVARVRNFSQGNGILILEDNENQALLGRGNGALMVNQGGVVVNSTGLSAAQTDGTVTALAATSFDITGGYTGYRFFLTPYPASGAAQPYTGAVPVPDPLKDLPEPNPSDYPHQDAPPNTGPAGTTITMQPGRYTQPVLYSGPRTVVLEPGIYVFEKGITLSGQVQMTANGVMIYNGGSGSQSISLVGQGEWTLTPPTSGTYKGVSIFQSRNADPSTTTSLAGNGGAGVTGTIYCPTTKTELTGNGTQVLGSQFISRTLELNGNGYFTVDFAGPKAPQAPKIELME